MIILLIGICDMIYYYQTLFSYLFLIRTAELMQVLDSRNEILCHVEMQENKFAVQPR